MIYLVLAVLLLHIISAPIVMGCSVSINNELRRLDVDAAVFALPILKKRIAFDRIEKSIENGKAKREVREASNDVENAVDTTKRKRFIVKLVKNILSRISVRAIVLDGTIGLSDAAVNAVVCTTVNIVYSQCCAYFGLPCRGGLAANDAGAIDATVGGIISISIADIIIALFKCAFTRSHHEGSRRIQRASD